MEYVLAADHIHKYIHIQTHTHTHTYIHTNICSVASIGICAHNQIEIGYKTTGKVIKVLSKVCVDERATLTK